VLPLGITKPRIEDFLPLVSKCEIRLACTLTFLPHAGRLELTNAILSALPTLHMCALALPKGVIRQIDKFSKYCLWRRAEVNSKKPPKVAWEMVCIPKIEGGLGVINLEKQNEALLMKKFRQVFQQKSHSLGFFDLGKHYSNGRLPNNRRKDSF
jgi:hypothetical protein